MSGEPGARDGGAGDAASGAARAASSAGGVTSAASGAAQAAILTRVRAAIGPHPRPPEVPRGYRVAGTLDRAGAVELFCERVADYTATVHRVEADGLAALLRSLCRGRTGVPAALALPDGIDAVVDDPALSVAALDELDAVLSGCALAIADTGTIVLDGAGVCGRRALTLVPDRHVCVVRARDVVPSVPDAIAALAGAARDGRPITFISGPSATSDIELERVEGVHGPRVLDVVVVD